MIEISVCGVGNMVIDVDPERGIGRGVNGVFAQAWLSGAVECYADLHIEWIFWRGLDFLAIYHEC